MSYSAIWRHLLTKSVHQINSSSQMDAIFLLGTGKDQNKMHESNKSAPGSGVVTRGTISLRGAPAHPGGNKRGLTSAASAHNTSLCKCERYYWTHSNIVKKILVIKNIIELWVGKYKIKLLNAGIFIYDMRANKYYLRNIGSLPFHHNISSSIKEDWIT